MSRSSLSAPKFELGRVVSTPGAVAALDDAKQEPALFLDRHVSGDWGDVDPLDRACNDAATGGDEPDDQSGRVLSAYQTSSGVTIWIITEWDRSATTLLLPSEY